jgi:hypothetical protein
VLVADLDLRTLEAFNATVKSLGRDMAERLMQQTTNRVGRSVARRYGESVAASLGIPAQVFRKRIVFIPMVSGEPARLRFMGTGKRGRGFVRPRHLGLELPRAGTFANGRPRFGQPVTNIPTRRSYAQAFVVTPGRGTKSSGNGKKREDRLGRMFKPWRGGTTGLSKATMFRRKGIEKYPIEQVPGYRLAELLNLELLATRARDEFVSEVSAELLRRAQVELAKRVA